MRHGETSIDNLNNMCPEALTDFICPNGNSRNCSNLDMYLKALMDNDISGPTLVGFRDEEWTAGIEAGEGCFNIGPVD